VAVVQSGAVAGFYAIQLNNWSPDVVLCTNGPAELPDDDRKRLSSRGIAVRSEAIARLEADGDGVRVVFSDGPSLSRHVLFIRPPTRQRSDLAAQLGCSALEDGSIEVNDLGQTSVPDVYAAGDMARRPSMPFPAAQAIHAASAGGVAAVAADRELLWAAIEAAG
jgi:thioredoxin reductase